MKEKSIKLRDFSKLFFITSFINLRKCSYKDENAKVWKKAFAFLLVKILRNGLEGNIYFKFYETRTYQEIDDKDEIISLVIRENRELDSKEVYREILYGISC